MVHGKTKEQEHWTSKNLRQEFLAFFGDNAHIITFSSSLTNSGDPSVILTTAGMQQFKPFYLEPKQADETLHSRRATSAQKCFRTTDIDEVGDATHNTFFEMLGNFSFGDYFKKEAIELAFELLTKRYKLKKDDFHVTIFAGDDQVPRDEESYQIWRSLGVKEDHITACGRDDNFWGPTGDAGPCGPTTEIYVNGVEIWNLVFNEFYFAGSRDELLSGNTDKRLESLANKGVDTGMGLERLALVMQHAPSIFETDVFLPLMRVIDHYVQRQDLSDKLIAKSSRIIADHMRGATFLMAEGLLPANVKAGYILRRILRRAIRFAHTLNLPHDTFAELIKTTAAIYHEPYPELTQNLSHVMATFEKEYQLFGKTLKKGMAVFEKTLTSAKSGVFPGHEAFFLFSSYGFPLELIEEMLSERQMTLEKEGFDVALALHRQKSKPQQS